MYLSAKSNKLPLNFVFKVVTVGFALGMTAILFFVFIISILINFFADRRIMFPNVGYEAIIVIPIFVVQGMFLGLLIALGLSIYSKCANMKISIHD